MPCRARSGLQCVSGLGILGQGPGPSSFTTSCYAPLLFYDSPVSHSLAGSARESQLFAKVAAASRAKDAKGKARNEREACRSTLVCIFRVSNGVDGSASASLPIVSLFRFCCCTSLCAARRQAVRVTHCAICVTAKCTCKTRARRAQHVLWGLGRGGAPCHESCVSVKLSAALLQTRLLSPCRIVVFVIHYETHENETPERRPPRRRSVMSCQGH